LNPVRIFVVDDHALFRESLQRLLDMDQSLQVVGGADSVASALKQLERMPTDVLILDYDLGAGTALDIVRGLRERRVQSRSLVVTAGLPDRDAMELIRLGVCGIFHKKNPPEELRRSIHEVAAGKILIDQSYLQNLMESVMTLQSSPIRLTDRDRRVLRMLLEGNSNKEIASALNLSESAAKAALQQLFAKTGVRTRSQLVRVALEELDGQI
jgi:two-component system nitrate/nitrite response regulator NarL